ncbi:orotate phosphoribosyltransferase [Azospirillum sp. TSO22-1]|uniref:orotate phosphoribosyltransferase n=1 Tax=Azospirillum sp. TSO22-1 TaxID=716789 RepID=UPI000D619F89|nr:orotate phosphoribosyltransferase [Azospirillum sp. TSO22-1]PWC55015.1 orotate phosphoribosyltransferase [Azospirillum sp. TSO22-1]
MIPDSWDLESREGAARIARDMLETGAVRFDPKRPFRYTDDLVSPVRLDVRHLLSYPKIRKEVVSFACEMINQEMGDTERTGVHDLDAIAAGEGAGMPFATLIADKLNLPLVIVRKDAPEIVGDVHPGWRVLLVEQLATDGHRKARFIEPLRKAGCEVRDVFVLFQYGIFDSIHEHLTRLGVTMHAACTWWDLLDVANRGSYLPEEALGEIHAYLHDPRRWCAQHGKQARVA